MLLQDVQDEYGFPVLSIIQLKHLVGYASTASSPLAAKLSDIEAYRAQYGVNY
jgi:orotate phosphoribosyltransferase